VFVSALLLLNACTSLNTLPEPEGLLLLPPVAEPGSQAQKQIISLDLHGKKVQFITVSQFTDQESRLMALWPSGQPVMDIRYDGSGFSEHIYGQLPVSGQDVMSVVQFSLWPEDIVKNFYHADSGWRVYLSDSERWLKYHDRFWLKVDINGDLYQVTHYKNNYRVEIEPAGK